MKQFIQNLIVLGLGAVATLYLLNPTAGLIEFIPDNFPYVGNLDEAAAVLLLLQCLRYFGIDLTGFFARTPSPSDDAPKPPPSE